MIGEKVQHIYSDDHTFWPKVMTGLETVVSDLHFHSTILTSFPLHA